MGEIADMILDGILCQCCGVFIGNKSKGDYPQYCANCAQDAKKNERRRNKEFRFKQHRNAMYM